MIVALGATAAGLGALLRWQAARHLSPRWSTALVNAAGSFALALLSTASDPVVAVMGIGGLGTFTTFSTLSHELVEAAAVSLVRLAAHAGINLIGGVGAAWVALAIVR